jgi:hypothetical protein
MRRVPTRDIRLHNLIEAWLLRFVKIESNSTEISLGDFNHGYQNKVRPRVTQKNQKL